MRVEVYNPVVTAVDFVGFHPHPSLLAYLNMEREGRGMRGVQDEGSRRRMGKRKGREGVQRVRIKEIGTLNMPSVLSSASSAAVWLSGYRC